MSGTTDLVTRYLVFAYGSYETEFTINKWELVYSSCDSQKASEVLSDLVNRRPLRSPVLIPVRCPANPREDEVYECGLRLMLNFISHVGSAHVYPSRGVIHSAVRASLEKNLDIDTHHCFFQAEE